MFNGKPVWKQDDFTYEAVKVGDYVEQAIVGLCAARLYAGRLLPDGRALFYQDG